MSLKYYIKKSENKDYTHDLTALNIVITKSYSNTSDRSGSHISGRRIEKKRDEAKTVL